MLDLSKTHYEMLGSDLESSFDEPYRTTRRKFVWIDKQRAYITAIVLLCLTLISTIFLQFAWNIPENRLQCRQAPFRREWRSLDTIEQQEYIQAVNCLRGLPSRIGLNHSLYDDFPWVHSQVGEYSHESAAFLAWHRYFISTYEKALQQDCHYSGHLTYWNWTLDWQDIRRAPVWGSSAFGSTGEFGVGQPVLHGHCVTDGPFANLEVLYLKGERDPHCLTRGFAAGEELANLSSWIRPSAIEKLLAGDDHEAFNLGLENAAHIAIPRSIRGDFLLFTAPYDPVFFLHHTQLDRLWSKWQSNGLGRARQYRGVAAHGSEREGSLSDSIPMGDLAADALVSDIIDTRSGILCYQY